MWNTLNRFFLYKIEIHVLTKLAASFSLRNQILISFDQLKSLYIYKISIIFLRIKFKYFFIYNYTKIKIVFDPSLFFFPHKITRTFFLIKFVSKYLFVKKKSPLILLMKNKQNSLFISTFKKMFFF